MVFRLTSILNPVLGALADQLDLRLWLVCTPAITATTLCLMAVSTNSGIACVLLFARALVALVIMRYLPT